MVWRKIREVLTILEVSLSGYRQCRGIFHIIDHIGKPLAGVSVSCRIGDSEWIPCGKSTGPEARVSLLAPRFQSLENFYQKTAVFYQIGEPVSWRFENEGLTPVTITRYTADTRFDANRDTIILHPEPITYLDACRSRASTVS